MNAAQIHLAFNHFPIVGSFFALVILIWGLVVKKDQIKTVGMVLIILSSLFSIIANSSGEGAEDLVKNKPLVTKEHIHAHEEAAEGAMIALSAAAVLGLVWLVMLRLNHKYKEKLLVFIVLVNVITVGLFANAAHKGGLIRHEEISNQ